MSNSPEDQRRLTAFGFASFILPLSGSGAGEGTEGIGATIVACSFILAVNSTSATVCEADGRRRPQRFGRKKGRARESNAFRVG